MISTTQFTYSQEPTVPTYDNLIKVLCSVEDLSFTDIMSWSDPKMHTIDKKKHPLSGKQDYLRIMRKIPYRFQKLNSY